MPNQVNPDPNQAQTHEGKLAAERMREGDEQVPNIDVEADYEASKQFSVSEVDRSGAGAEAAEAVTAPEFEVPEPEETQYIAEPTGNPDDYRDMARDLSPKSDAVTSVSDDLVRKALEKGEPGQ